MSITGYTLNRVAGVVQVTAASDLSEPIYLHWYVDGVYVGWTPHGTPHVERPAPNEQLRIMAVDDTGAPEDFDAAANAPDEYPARHELFWVRTLDSDLADVREYLIEQKKDSDDWVELGRVAHFNWKWSYHYITPRLTDLAQYQWRVTPLDAAGNSGTALSMATRTVVRRPDAPDYTVAWNPAPSQATFTAA